MTRPLTPQERRPGESCSHRSEHQHHQTHREAFLAGIEASKRADGLLSRREPCPYLEGSCEEIAWGYGWNIHYDERWDAMTPEELLGPDAALPLCEHGLRGHRECEGAGR